MEIFANIADGFFTSLIDGVAFLDENLNQVQVSVSNKNVGYIINQEIARKLINHCESFNFSIRNFDKDVISMQLPEFSLSRVRR